MACHRRHNDLTQHSTYRLSWSDETTWLMGAGRHSSAMRWELFSFWCLHLKISQWMKHVLSFSSYKRFPSYLNELFITLIIKNIFIFLFQGSWTGHTCGPAKAEKTFGRKFPSRTQGIAPYRFKHISFQVFFWTQIFLPIFRKLIRSSTNIDMICKCNSEWDYCNDPKKAHYFKALITQSWAPGFKLHFIRCQSQFFWWLVSGRGWLLRLMCTVCGSQVKIWNRELHPKSLPHS